MAIPSPHDYETDLVAWSRAQAHWLKAGRVLSTFSGNRSLPSPACGRGECPTEAASYAALTRPTRCRTGVTGRTGVTRRTVY